MSITDFGKWVSSTNAMIDFEEWNFLVRRGLAKPYSFLVRYNSTASVYEALYGDEELAGQVAYGGEDNLGSTTGTNSAAVINAALDALSGTAMERVVLQGTFSAVEAQLDITKSYTYLDLRQAHLTLANSVDDDLIESTATTVDNFWIHGGYLDANGSNNTDGSCIKINTQCNDWFVSDVYCTNANDFGIELTSGGTMSQGSILNCYLNGNGAGGLRVAGTEHRINNCHLQGNTTEGIELTSGTTGHAITGCIIADNTTDGIAATGTTDVAISGCTIRNNTQDGISLDSGSHRNTITGCYIGANGYHGITISGDYNILSSNNFDGNSVGNNDTYNNIDLVSGGDYSVILGNVLNGSNTVTKYGIDVASDKNVIKSNVVYNHATMDIWNTGANNTFDHMLPCTLDLDLSGANNDIFVYHANAPAHLCGYRVVYTEASSADAGVNIVVGRYQDGVAIDDNYFDSSTSEVSKNLGYSKEFVSSDLSAEAIIEGDTVTVGTDGGKVGTGEVRLVLFIAEVSDT